MCQADGCLSILSQQYLSHIPKSSKMKAFDNFGFTCPRCSYEHSVYYHPKYGWTSEVYYFMFVEQVKKFIEEIRQGEHGCLKCDPNKNIVQEPIDTDK